MQVRVRFSWKYCARDYVVINVYFYGTKFYKFLTYLGIIPMKLIYFKHDLLERPFDIIVS